MISTSITLSNLTGNLDSRTSVQDVRNKFFISSSIIYYELPILVRIFCPYWFFISVFHFVTLFENGLIHDA